MATGGQTTADSGAKVEVHGRSVVPNPNSTTLGTLRGESNRYVEGPSRAIVRNALSKAEEVLEYLRALNR